MVKKTALRHQLIGREWEMTNSARSGAAMASDKRALRKRGRAFRLNSVKRRWQLFLFLLIPVVWVIIFNYVPMVGVQIAFRKYKIRDGI